MYQNGATTRQGRRYANAGAMRATTAMPEFVSGKENAGALVSARRLTNQRTVIRPTLDYTKCKFISTDGNRKEKILGCPSELVCPQILGTKFIRDGVEWKLEEILAETYSVPAFKDDKKE